MENFLREITVLGGIEITTTNFISGDDRPKQEDRNPKIPPSELRHPRRSRAPHPDWVEEERWRENFD
ncbi:hypothetical protein DLM78_19265 [Leptospira stimsonii]|uniref:Uncharacterized protein n=1 Tax=Leptospira stimsonii TaxID=2202203 RepID=A0A8B3CPR3_9LEPT|nr:hypothetical protein DLM78_19265 [Leptospira stimsonii]